MPPRIHLAPHLTADELHARYRQACEPVERSRWHFLWLLAQGLTATAVAGVTGYSAYWIGQIARRYNRDGPDGMRDRRIPSRGGTYLGAHIQQSQPTQYYANQLTSRLTSGRACGCRARPSCDR